MKKTILFIFILSFVSCSTTQNVRKRVNKEDITSDDFKKAKQVDYTDAKDSFDKIELFFSEVLPKRHDIVTSIYRSDMQQ